ncbi:tRNA (guanosine(37)-N1)-methyltransferase TrmD [Patescibacteria group bacterium]|nr:tRNA (guanosine(37)-N1)-methyltransferase TrmD [Patescibacteria group bacterium]
MDILTLFPKMFEGPFSESLIFRAKEKGIVKIKIHNLRGWAEGKHLTVDDSPYGGGAGMVIKVDVLDRALSTLKSEIRNPKSETILLTPQGKTFNQKMAKKLSKYDHLILICGHYEGFDERVRNLVDEEISIGDYILTGGELPVMVLADAVVRLLPGVVAKNDSIEHESFENNLLDYPAYTKPEVYTPRQARGRKKWRVPKILLSGDHQKINKWRENEAIKRTKKRRPDLLK